MATMKEKLERMDADHKANEAAVSAFYAEDPTPYCAITGADMTVTGLSLSGCPCCGWHLTNGVCGACGQEVRS